MGYAYELENSQQLVVENDSEGTLVSLSSGGEGQQQSQATGFDTGKWSKAPTLFRLKKDLILRVETKEETWYLRVRGNEIRRMTSEPDLENAEKLRLDKSDTPVRMKPMEPMKPMGSMKPMQPMEPMKPFKPMRPMEMQMGEMRMSMGGGEPKKKSAQRFCTECGNPVREGDRYCGGCGKPLSTGE
jgi:hypothetical protein